MKWGEMLLETNFSARHFDVGDVLLLQSKVSEAVLTAWIQAWASVVPGLEHPLEKRSRS